MIYGRRRGRRMRPGRRALIARLLPKLSVPLPDVPDPAPIALAGLFDRPVRDLWLEIGFGGGEHLATQAAANPDIGMIGCEPFAHGLGQLLSRIEAAGLANIRIVAGDARPLLRALPEACLGRVFVLFPDPWPKRRHHKRRLVDDELLALLARVMKDGAELRLATDHPGYLRWMLAHLLRHPAFEWTARGPRDWRARPGDWPQTRYERKALAAGHVCTFLRFRRRRPRQSRLNA